MRESWLLLLTLGVIAAPALTLAQPRELPARIVTLGGHAEVSRKAAPAWGDAALRDDLLEGDGVRTLAGRLTLRTGSGQSLRLGPRTQVFFAAADGVADGGPTRVRMNGGRLWLSVLGNSPGPSRIELHAGSVTVTASAGGASITMNPDGSVLVAVYHGTVTCAGTGWERTLAQDQELTVPAAGRPGETAKLKRDKRDADWTKWNEQQDLAGGYGVRHAEK